MKKYNATAGFTFFGIVGFTLVIIILMATKCAKAQDVSLFVGASTNENRIYGAEFKTNTVGFFVEKYNCKHDYLPYELPPNQLQPPSPSNVIYDGVMFGANYHLKAMSNTILSLGIGILNEYVIYGEFGDKPTNTMICNQRFGIEMSAGKDYCAGDNIIIGIRGGVNNCTNIFGTISIGYKL